LEQEGQPRGAKRPLQINNMVDQTLLNDMEPILKGNEMSPTSSA
jgi:hypothetical protein